ncbi:glycosyltransferase 87 family protein [Pengzhenrongella sicca]|uniref:DUF2029 domain-containing protein n=1 Tax=Pengzhenrongella sicca TaxID=2819238 RepID=A0A8A4ZBP2_9MICO|nr:glycosyltransferase 87 family protein [Pengzhenrongella sicca]QTE29304.1 DUF2029 domain-containing protein [Pengzhenrongella sicca]
MTEAGGPGGGRRPGVRRWAGAPRWADGALWPAFFAVHAWLAYVGVALIPARAFYDVDLYRYWVALGLAGGGWPVLDGPWVYPAGALLPMLVPAAISTTSTVGYALGWSALVTALDAAAVALLLHGARAAERRRPGADLPGGRRAAWWWLAFLVLLGPVAMGRIDAILAPIVVVALLVAARRPRVAAALLTAGAWIKVAPGVLLVPLLLTVRRPVRDVVVPAALMCAGVVGAVAAGGGLRHVASFLFTQDARGLQVEAVAATGWVLASLVRDDVAVVLNDELITWEIVGPGTAAAARALDVALPLAVLALGALLWRARARPLDVVLWGSLALATLLIVVNKVGSPQYIGWLAPPIVVALAARGAHAGGADPDGADASGGLTSSPAALRRVAAGVLVIAALTQVVFPTAYPALLAGSPAVTAVLALRNVGLVALLAGVCVLLARSPARRAQVTPAPA